MPLRYRVTEVNGYVQGAYGCHCGTPQCFQAVPQQILPELFQSPPAANAGQNFTFSFEFGQVDKLIRAFTDDVKGLNGTQVSGALNTLSGQVTLNAAVPYAAYNEFGVRNLLLKANGDFEKINVSTSIGNVLYNDSDHIHQSPHRSQFRQHVLTSSWT